MSDTKCETLDPRVAAWIEEVPELKEFAEPEKMQAAKAYNRTGLRCMLADRALDLAFFAVFTFCAAQPGLEWLEKQFPLLASNLWLSIAAFLAGMMLIHVLISFPLSFYSGWMVEKRYDLTNLTAFHWFRRYVLQMTLVFLMNFLLLTALLFLVRLCGASWWIVVSILFFFFSMILGCLFPVLILPLFYKVEKLENDALLARFQALTRSTTLKLTGIFRLNLSVETSKANAMLAGLGASRRVLLGDTLLEKYTDDEITAVFAHEVGHHVHQHMKKMMLGMFCVSFLVFWLTDLGLRLWLGGSPSANIDYAQLPVWTLSFFLLATSIIGLFLEPLQNAASRRFERQADAFAVSRCEDPSALRRAFLKLAFQNKAEFFPSRWEVFWFHSHPSIGERLGNISRKESVQNS